MSIKFAARLTVCFVLASLIPLLSTAQQTTPATPSDSAAPTQARTPSQDQPAPAAPQGQAADKNTSPDKDKNGQVVSDQGKVPGTSNDRLFKVLPNFLTVENANLKPLTAKQKFKVVALGTFDPVQYPWWGLLSAINQAENSEPGYGQGWAAYGKRYGTTAADSTIENFIVGAVLPSILHQDPRFYYSSKGGFGRRALYAGTRIFITRGDSGHGQFNFSEIVGSALSASISTYSYHPKSTYVSVPTNPHRFVSSDRTLLNTANVWATQVSLDTITIVVKEFWPDIQRKISSKHHNDAATATPVTSKP